MNDFWKLWKSQPQPSGACGGPKLIEVALPLPEINDASAYDKMGRIEPHPRGIHHWWVRLPLPVARAVLFASVVDDPSAHPDKFPTEEAQERERERLFGIIRAMMQPQLHKHPEVYAQARAEMLKHCDGRLPALLDPFAGGGSIPLEASRLGMEAYAGDLNPVAVLLNTCNLELAPRWADRPPVNPNDRTKISGADGWRGTTGLAADVRHYGRVILARARGKIGHLYPPVKVTAEMAAEHPHLKPYVGKALPVIAWLWARTVASPNPAARGAHVPLMSTFWLFSRKGSKAWLEPIVDLAAGTWRFLVRTGPPKDRETVKAGTKTGRAQFRCLLTGDPITNAHIKAEGKAGRLGTRLVAIVADAGRRRVYLPATEEQEAIAGTASATWRLTPRQLGAMVTLSDLVRAAQADVQRDALAAGMSEADAKDYARAVVTSMVWDFAESDPLAKKTICWLNAALSWAESSQPSGSPETELPEKALGLRLQAYGINKHSQLFTPRQLTAMVTLSDLVREVREDVQRDALAAGLSEADAEDYARAVVTFLALALDRCADFNNVLSRWKPSGPEQMPLSGRQAFGRQVILMLWDFAEANLLAEKAICWLNAVDRCAEAVETIVTAGVPAFPGHACSIDAARPWDGLKGVLVSTDPPYCDNIGYAALSDFFYVWLRRTIGDLYPDLFATILTPKEPELAAVPERFDGDRFRARRHFEDGFRRAFVQLREKMDPRFPLTVYYGFKQNDEESGADEEEGSGNRINRTTGWETMLTALNETGYQITATWPVQLALKSRQNAMGTNSLASYIVLACRPRPADAPETDRRSFVAELKRELPVAIKRLQQGSITPVDFAQAAIGRSMAIYSKYRRILEASGRPMSVRTALALINQTLTEVLSEAESEIGYERVR